MNSVSRVFMLLALLGAAPALAQDGKPATKEPAARTVAPPARSPIETAFENVRQKTLAGDADRAAYQELTAAIQQGYAPLEQFTPDTATVRARLVSAVDEIYERAQRAKIAPEEFAGLRIELLDADLLCEFAGLAARPGPKAVEAFATRYQRLADAVEEFEPAATEGRTRAQALLDGLRQQPAVETADLEPLYEELAHGRALRSAVLLEKHAVAKGATRTDYARARDQLFDLLELQARRDPEARELQKQLVGAIDDLERRGAETSLTHADFESLRKALAQRGRTALAERLKPHG